MYADGCVYASENRVEITLKGSDIQHLHKFAKFLKTTKNNFVKYYNATLKRPHSRCRVVFRSTKMHNALKEKGCVPNKSLILKFPDSVIFSNKDLIRHFIRGYIDGDGCLCITQNKCILSILGTKEFLLDLSKYLPLTKEYPIYKQRKNSSSNVYVFQL